MIEFNCRVCGTKISVSDDARDTRVRCATCANILLVPLPVFETPDALDGLAEASAARQHSPSTSSRSSSFKSSTPAKIVAVVVALLLGASLVMHSRSVEKADIPVVIALAEKQHANGACEDAIATLRKLNDMGLEAADEEERQTAQKLLEKYEKELALWQASRVARLVDAARTSLTNLDRPTAIRYLTQASSYTSASNWKEAHDLLLEIQPPEHGGVGMSVDAFASKNLILRGESPAISELPDGTRVFEWDHRRSGNYSIQLFGPADDLSRIVAVVDYPKNDPNELLRVLIIVSSLMETIDGSSISPIELGKWLGAGGQGTKQAGSFSVECSPLRYSDVLRDGIAVTFTIRRSDR